MIKIEKPLYFSILCSFMPSTKAYFVSNPGGPESFVLKNMDLPILKDYDVLIKHKAIGINYLDVEFRKGSTPFPENTLPIAGMEASGIVEAIGAKVTSVKVGQRVAYATGPVGAYAQKRVIHEHFLVNIPDDIEDHVVASLLFKGMAAHYLLFRTFRIAKNLTILVHSATGGVGHYLTQWAHAMGATVIGTVGSTEKISIAEQLGCSMAFNYRTENVSKKILEFTEGKGVCVIYDPVGKDVFEASLSCLSPYGLFVSYGQTSGNIPPFDIQRLAPLSLFVTRPSLFRYKANRMELVLSANEVFAAYRNKILIPHENTPYPFEQLPQAHKDLESRRTIGALVVTL